MLYIYKASAGSGKTYTLSKEYIKLLLKDPNSYRSVLAITFTKAAMAEMKSRILKYLQGLSEQKEEALMNDLVKELSFSKEHIAQQAQKATKNILFNYTQFNISTIDSFFVGLIKSCAREMGIITNAEIELSETKILKHVISELVQVDDDEIQTFFRDYVLQLINNGEGWNIEKEMSKIGKNVFNDSLLPFLNDTDIDLTAFIKGVESLYAFNKTFEEEITNYGFKLCDVLNNNHSNGIVKTSVEKAFIKMQKNPILTDASVRLFSNKSYYLSKKDPIQNVDDEIEGFINYYLKNYQDYLFNKNILKNILSVGLFDTVRDHLAFYTSENNILLLKQAYEVFKKEVAKSDAPVIYEKTGTKIRHLFIDEFQDTSDTQWNCMLPLVSEVLANDGNVHILGDVKQAIYRWRNGNMKLLLRDVERHFSAYKTDPIQLKTNWRSAKEIVAFNNDFFDAYKATLNNGDYGIIPQEDWRKVYEESNQNIQNTDMQGYVSIQTFEGKNDEYLQTSLDHLVDYIKDAKENRGFSYDKITILARGNKHIKTIIPALINDEIPFTTVGGVLLEDSRLVNIILEHANYLISEKGEIHAFNAQQLAIKKASKKELSDTREHWKNLSLREVIYKIIDFWDLEIANDAVCIHFLEWMEDQCKYENNTIRSFLEIWEENKEYLKLDTEVPEAVKIMTIHKAKGLENDIVLLPLLDMDMQSQGTTILWSSSQQKEHDFSAVLPISFVKNLYENDNYKNVYENEKLEALIENSNLLYVAFTRAKKELYISCKTAKLEFPSSINKNFTANKLIQHLIPKLNTLKQTENGYTYGEKNSYKEEKKDKDPVPIKTNVHPSIDLSKKPISLRIQSDRIFELQKSGQRVTKGNILHAYFEEYATSLNHDRTIDIISDLHLLDANNVIWLKDMALKLWDTIPELQKWYSEDYKSVVEKEFFMQGSLQKPDVIFLQNQKATIVDFKLGKPDIKYEHQINRYAAGLSKMGYEIEAKYLLLMERNELHKVL